MERAELNQITSTTLAEVPRVVRQFHLEHESNQRGDEMTEVTRQGDVLLVKLPKRVDVGRLAPIQREDGDVVLAHGEATGHKHRFRRDTTRMFSPWPKGTSDTGKVAHARKLLESLPAISADALVVGIVDLAAPDELVHEEHGAIPRAAGQYVVIRQRTYTPAGIIAVAD
jgi:hypothetical protein